MRMAAPVFFAPREPHRMVEVDVDEPGPGEVRVRTVASGICLSGLHAMDGDHSGTPRPVILGDEGASSVEVLS